MGNAVSGGLGLGRPLGAVPYIFRESDPAIPETHMMYHVGPLFFRVFIRH